MEAAIALRDIVAHQSDDSRQRFKEATTALKDSRLSLRVNNVGRSPGAYLGATSLVKGRAVSRLDLYLDGLERLSRHLG
jgi:hypothetical protein